MYVRMSTKQMDHMPANTQRNVAGLPQKQRNLRHNSFLLKVSCWSVFTLVYSPIEAQLVTGLHTNHNTVHFPFRAVCMCYIAMRKPKPNSSDHS